MRTLVIATLIAACSSPGRAPGPSAGSQTPPPADRLPDPPVPGLRLPGDVRPASYELDLTIVPEAERAVGRIKIEARVVRPTKVVWLNATGLAIGTASLAGSKARYIQGDDDMFGLTLDRELAPGNLMIDVAFEAPIERTKSVGIYAERENDAVYAYTFFEPIDARRAFPCFDEPNYKVPWKLSFHVRKDHIALGNAPVVKTTDEAGDMKRVELAVSKPLPSYLVAFVVGPFETVDGGAAGRIGTPVRFIIPQGRAGELAWAKKVTPVVVSALENYFDMPYPYGKLDVAVVPRFWGTMEHPGIVAMGQPLTLIRPDQETRQRKQSYANILAHELGHYWFGDYVTMAWWDDTWLNESLGQWLDTIITHAVEPAWRYPDWRVDGANGAMEADERLVTQAIRKPVDTKEGIAASFDGSITYAKGAAVLRMFEMWTGEERWREMIRGYIKKHAWGTTTADDLFRSVRDSLGGDNEQALRSFFEQPGVPRVASKLSCPAGGPPKLALAQTRALPAGSVDPKPKKWRVPVCMRYGDDRSSTRGCWLLEDETKEVALETKTCPAWIIANAGGNGYYRSTVDAAAVKALLTPGSAMARAAQPTASEKLMLLADLKAAVERDEVPLDKLLELAPVIATDPDERVALYATAAGGFRSDPLDDAMFAKAEKFWLRAYGPLAKKLGWVRAATDSDERHLLRRRMLGATATVDPAFAKLAEPLVDRWLADRTGIADDLVDTALWATARYGGRARFDAYLKAARGARDRTEKARILTALGGFREPALVQEALALVLGKEFDLRDSIGILSRIAGDRKTRAAGTEFAKAHADELLARMRDDEASWFLGELAELPCTAEHRKVIADIVGPRAPKYPGSQAYVDRGLEASALCITQFARQLPALQRFLNK